MILVISFPKKLRGEMFRTEAQFWYVTTTRWPSILSTRNNDTCTTLEQTLRYVT